MKAVLVAHTAYLMTVRLLARPQPLSDACEPLLDATLAGLTECPLPDDGC